VMANGKKITEIGTVIGKEQALYGKYVLLRRGKKNYYLIDLVD